MGSENIKNFIKIVLNNMPADWQKLTTHRLDLYNEELAKVQFLDEFENLFVAHHGSKDGVKDGVKEGIKGELKNLPTAFDYIRLGHPLSCILEWAIAKSKQLKVETVISFSSASMPILAILRKNLLESRTTQIFYKNKLPKSFEEAVLKDIYGYQFDLVKIENNDAIPNFHGSNILLTEFDEVLSIDLGSEVDFVIGTNPQLGSIALVNGEKNAGHIAEIQHVRRRESIAMTPNDCLKVLEQLVGHSQEDSDTQLTQKNTSLVLASIEDITNTDTDASIGSSGLAIQYAIMMGLVHHSLDVHKHKDIKFIVPPNCYGGTNDQARRVAACIANVEVVDLPVDGEQNMVESIEKALDQVATQDAVAFIIAEIPTNPRVEVPELKKLTDALSTVRTTSEGLDAIAPVFILDQTFCPNVKLLQEGGLLSSVKTISYVSASKFPSGGMCTAGYCVANAKAAHLMGYIDNHLQICGNQATPLQIQVLAQQMPSMNQRISDAYQGTREFVDFIEQTLPKAKINFVSKDLAVDGFTPSVFSIDLPTQGETKEDKENHKRVLNLNLINMMINEIPNESKHCVSYGQLKGCYWTIPATSTQGTTKEGDKDYIVRVAMSPEFDLGLHKKVFSDFCKKFISSHN